MKLKNFKIVTVILLFLSFSCVPVKKLSYFNDVDQMQGYQINPRLQKKIMPFDKLFIKVMSIDPQTSQIFNTTEEVRSGNYGSSGIIGYLVDESGNVNYPFVGNINVVNLTTAEAGMKIQTALNDYVANTYVIVKYVDNYVTVMGEVNRQGVYTFSQDKISIYDAIGLGGGITRYGNRKNVIVTRRLGEKLMHYKLNLSTSQIASKDYYYILPSDVIIVEPLGTISSSYQNITYTTILTSITTLIAILLLLGY